MSIPLKPVDAVIVGLGWTGSIVARELTRAGLKVVALERGPDRSPDRDFTLPGIRDELRYAIRGELFQDVSQETITLRHDVADTALPVRRLGAFLPGTGVGGAGSHWNGLSWRYLPSDLKLRSHLEQRYGKNAIPDELTIADFPVSYDELEPYYDRFEKLAGVSGQAGNLRGKLQPGGNVFEGARSSPYPNPPLQQTLASGLFADAARGQGYHPFPSPASNASQAYINNEGLTLGGCAYCGHCERFGCEANAKASPHSTLLPLLRQDKNFELRANSYVKELVYDASAGRITAVRYIDLVSGEEREQPAALVILASYVFSNTLLLRQSNIGQAYDPVSGQGVVGKNYGYQAATGVQLFFKDRAFNPFMGAGAAGSAIDDFNGDNFDHTGLGFFGGAIIASGNSGARPIGYHPVPPGTPRWGSAWKHAVAEHYNSTAAVSALAANYSHRSNYLDLDPLYRDALGRPLLRLTYDFRPNDRALIKHLAPIVKRIGQAMGADQVTDAPLLGKHFSVIPYQTTHNSGGTITGDNPSNSVVNRYLQHWQAHNLFVLGASVFPQNASYNPTLTVGALAYWAADAIKRHYLKSPGALVAA